LQPEKFKQLALISSFVVKFDYHVVPSWLYNDQKFCLQVFNKDGFSNSSTHDHRILLLGLKISWSDKLYRCLLISFNKNQTISLPTPIILIAFINAKI
jgi:hypothetical protein